MKKDKKVYILVMTVAAFMVALVLLTRFSSVTQNTFEDTTIDNYKSGDCKFAFNDQIVGNENGNLSFLHVNTGKTDIISAVKTNWSSLIPDEKLMVYSNGDGKTGIAKFAENDQVVLNRTIFTEDTDLRIDPTLIKFGGTYYMTSTLIQGPVNQSDPNAENGVYTIQLYSSDDMVTWKHVADIASAQNNLEDVDIMADGNLLRVTYEKETRDKAPSSIIEVSSSDNGQTWGHETVLLPDNGDNEPATFTKVNDQYYLFYSSDVNNPGTSYSGASVYLSKYDESLQLVSTTELQTNPSSNILLYDTLIDGNNVKLLFASDYLGSNNLNIETVALP
ncbi:MAG: hypothetical protein ACOYB8_00750 [Eubacteriaceae bacterium]